METVSTGPFMMRSTCRRCHGKGVYVKSPCADCRGSGQTRQHRKVRVPVPAGIENGQTVRMGVGQKEVFVTFSVEPSDYFRRQGADVHTDAKISLSQAVFGGAIRVAGVYEDINVRIPEATASHARMRLPGKGIKKASGYGYGQCCCPSCSGWWRRPFWLTFDILFSQAITTCTSRSTRPRTWTPNRGPC